MIWSKCVLLFGGQGFVILCWTVVNSPSNHINRHMCQSWKCKKMPACALSMGPWLAKKPRLGLIWQNFCTCCPTLIGQNRQVKLGSARHGTSCISWWASSGRCTRGFPLRRLSIESKQARSRQPDAASFIVYIFRREAYEQKPHRSRKRFRWTMDECRR